MVLQFLVSAVQQSHGRVWLSVAVTETPVSRPGLVGTERQGRRPLSAGTGHSQYYTVLEADTAAGSWRWQFPKPAGFLVIELEPVACCSSLGDPVLQCDAPPRLKVPRCVQSVPLHSRFQLHLWVRGLHCFWLQLGTYLGGVC